MRNRKYQVLCAIVAITLTPLLLTYGCGITSIIGVTCGDLGALICGSELYCKYDDGICGQVGESGVCVRKPEACTTVFAPICGCDGHTYGNECEAARNGVSIRFDGPCETDGLKPICGGIAGFLCKEGNFCKYKDGACSSSDQSGVCMSIPEVCTLEFAPVCGCDGVTYGNQCQADSAGVSIESTGECPTGG